MGLNKNKTSLIKPPLDKNTFFALFTFIVVVRDLPHKIPPEFSGSWHSMARANLNKSVWLVTNTNHSIKVHT
jgi:hypothetical protein